MLTRRGTSGWRSGTISIPPRRTAAIPTSSLSRQELGTAVFGGMIAATILSVFFVPVFFVIMQGASDRWARWRGRKPRHEAAR
jgi:hypothetical protein